MLQLRTLGTISVTQNKGLERDGTRSKRRSGKSSTHISSCPFPVYTMAGEMSTTPRHYDLQWWANVAQILNLFVTLAIWLWPDLPKKAHIDPQAIRTLITLVYVSYISIFLWRSLVARTTAGNGGNQQPNQWLFSVLVALTSTALFFLWVGTWLNVPNPGGPIASSPTNQSPQAVASGTAPATDSSTAPPVQSSPTNPAPTQPPPPTPAPATLGQQAASAVRSGDPLAWQRDYFRSTSAFRTITSGAHNGVRAVCIVSPTQNDARWIQRVTVKPDTFYIVSGWIRAARYQRCIPAWYDTTRNRYLLF